MAQPQKQIDRKLLRTFEPINRLTADKFEEIIDKSTIEEYPAGRTLFRQGERDKRSYFLMQGQVELSEIGKPRTTIVKAKTPDTVNAIADKRPRCCTAKAKTSVTVFVVDPDLLDILLCADHTPDAYQVTELSAEDDTNDWMLKFLQSSTFLHLPTENIQRLLMSMEEIQAKSGTVIVEQGAEDDYYYIVKRGQCAVSRKPARKAADVRLAILSNGDGFGEEALITNGKRNATVTMLEDGKLMRLHKENFIPLLVDPLLDYIDDNTATTLIKGGSHLIDVRTNDEFHQDTLPGATNIPLSALRTRINSLNAERDYIVFCNDGTLSAAAAFLMTQQGRKCQVLQGGLNASSLATTRTKTADENVVSIKHDKKPKPAKKAQKAATANADTAKPAASPKQTAAATRSPAGFKDAVKPVATKQAEIAENASTRLQQEAEELRKQADELADKTAQAEAAKTEARRELEKLKQEEIARKEAELNTARQHAQEQSRRAEEAEKARLKALREAEQLQKQQEKKKEKEVQAARKRAEQEAKRAETAEAAHQKALKEAQRMQRMQQTHYTAELDAACKRAEQEAERAKQAEQARQTALAEAKRLEENTARHNAELETARKRVEEEAERAKQAEQASQNALNEAERLKHEAESIKQQAVEETERLRADASATRKLAEDELARIRAQAEAAATRQAELESERERARDEARKAAEAASSARERAEQDAERMRDEARLAAEAASTARQEAQEEAERLRAEAEEIRRQAQEEAERLREELTSARQQMAQEAAKAREEAESAAKIRREAEEAAAAQAAAARAAIAKKEAEAAARARAEAEAEARKQLEIEAEARAKAEAEAAARAEAEAEARRELEVQAEARARAEAEAEAAMQARAKAEEAARARAEVEAAARTKAEAEAEARRRAEEAARAEQAARRRLEEERQRQAARDQSEAKAREMAEEIVAKLHEADQQRKVEGGDEGDGLSLARTQVREVKGRTILEGEEDIFIFQRPKALHEEDDDDEDNAALSAPPVEDKSTRAKAKKSDDDVPSFIIDDNDEHISVQSGSAGGDDYDFSSLAPISAVRAGPQENKTDTGFSLQRHKRTILAVAASVVLVGVIGVVSLTRDTYVDVEKVAAIVEPEKPTTKAKVAEAASKADKQLAGIIAARKQADARVRDEAESEYQRLLSKWKQQLQTADPLDSASDDITPTANGDATLLNQP